MPDGVYWLPVCLYPPLACDDALTDYYGRIRFDLQRHGVPIGGNEQIIAAIALAHEATLVTANTREFGRVVGLKFENWEQGQDA